MFILFLTTDRQIDRRTLQQADSLEQYGHTVRILAMPLESPHADDDPRITRIQMTHPAKGRKIPHLIWSFYKKLCLFLPMNGFLMRFAKHLSFMAGLKPDVFYQQIFTPWLQAYTPDVVIAVDLPLLPLAHHCASRTKARLIYDSHELYSEQAWPRHQKTYWQRREAAYIHHCHAVITVNPSIGAELERRYGIPPVQIIYNAIPKPQSLPHTRRFHEHFNLPAHHRVVLYQGGLTEGRHLKSLIQAMHYLRHTDIHLILLGEGILQKKLQTLVQANQLHQTVHFHPHVPQADLLTYTKAADLGIIPYQATCLNHYYCTPNKLFEFIAAGVPILASDLPEIRKIIRTYQIGCTHALSTPKDIAQALEGCLQDEEQLKRWDQNLLRAQSECNWEQEAPRFVRIIEACI